MQKVHQYNRICMQAKSEFLKAKIQDNHHDPKKLWRVLGDVLHRLLAKMLPSINPPRLLADRFVEFFTEKIEKIRSTFPTSLKSQHIAPDSPPPVLSTFSTVTKDQVTKIIILDYLDILITPITSIINASLEKRKCPNFFKQAHVTPIIKKSSLDKEIFKNYRPVSNLNFISKILERIVAVQLQTHLDEAGLMTAFQSAYRKHHSTESALLNIHNDILLNMAKGSVTALTLLDLSAAFDTIDHTILLDRLNIYYGISELTLGWFKSYLSGRTHSVKVGNTLSHPAALQYGIPQGSVLGPILFSLYTNPISSIVHSHSNINHHFYADDTQLYITLTNFSRSIQKLKNCLSDIQNFMSANKLKLNPEKTEFILIGSKNNRKQLLPHFPINILGNQVSPAQSVRNLGVVFDSSFSFSDHVSQVIKSTRVHTRDLYRIRTLLDLNTSVLLANALVSSRLDYCNSLFLSLTDFELRRLQLIQNSLCRVVTRSSKYSHITPQLKKLHWLPIKYRKQFKIGLITYKILNQDQTIYLREFFFFFLNFFLFFFFFAPRRVFLLI